MKVPLICLLPLLIAGCPANTIVGRGDTGSESVGATTASTTGAGPATSSSSGTGSGGSSAGVTSGGTSGATSGATSGGTSGGADGGCLALGELCGGNSACCSGACNGVCAQASEQGCLEGSQCSSGLCTNEVCACTSDGGCAAETDCCGSVATCSRGTSLQGAAYGLCCSAIGAACEIDPGSGYTSCCTHIPGYCVNNICQCLPPNTEGCNNDSDCCEGTCFATSFGHICRNTAGEPCPGPDPNSGSPAQYLCASLSCIDGLCGACSNPHGLCATTDDCCSGEICAGFTTSGPGCCIPTGFTCDAGSDCCSSTCENGSCTCVGNSQPCVTDHSCCSGSVCLAAMDAGGPRPLQQPWLGTITPSACCRLDGNSCFADGDCCSGTCQNQQCGCVATGGKCGLAGQVAPEGAQACCSGQCGSGGACL